MSVQQIRRPSISWARLALLNAGYVVCAFLLSAVIINLSAALVIGGASLVMGSVSSLALRFFD